MPLDRLTRRTFVLACAAAGASGLQAQQWPGKEIKLVVPSTPGSPPDLLARILIPGLSAAWKQPIVVDYKPGAGGMIGMNTVAKAAPDGHTIGIGFAGPVTYAPLLYKKMAYDPFKDFAPVCLTTTQPNILIVPAGHPANNLREFVEWSHTIGDKANFASVGPGTASHLTMELFKSVAKIKPVHVPYPGSPPALSSLLAGDCHSMFITEPPAKGAIAGGRVKVLAATSPQRTPLLKDVPTVAESGFPGFEVMAWNGVFAPAGTPAAVLRKIASDVREQLASDAVSSALLKMGSLPLGSTPEEFTAAIKADFATWSPILRKLNLTLD